MGCDEKCTGGGEVTLGAANRTIGMEVVITFDPFIYEPADIMELEEMLLSVTERWWKMREFLNARGDRKAN